MRNWTEVLAGPTAPWIRAARSRAKECSGVSPADHCQARVPFVLRLAAGLCGDLSQLLRAGADVLQCRVELLACRQGQPDGPVRVRGPGPERPGGARGDDGVARG